MLLFVQECPRLSQEPFRAEKDMEMEHEVSFQRPLRAVGRARNLQGDVAQGRGAGGH